MFRDGLWVERYHTGNFKSFDCVMLCHAGHPRLMEEPRPGSFTDHFIGTLGHEFRTNAVVVRSQRPKAALVQWLEPVAGVGRKANNVNSVGNS